ncbi:MAG: Sapep family Mn(2+)-dependent dipeptidase [Clostridia bacterium]|nr:Sapep family Mn(2+)-dependent dipeptidase [Clostridia bacterium]
MKEYLASTVRSISESIRFDSSRQKKARKAPFGKGALECLQHFLALAQGMGFTVHNYDGYVGDVEFGEGKESFAILCHLDVVPAGNGWTKDPFGGVVSEGKIWGRGAVDDKGPAICCLYALKALKDEGFIPSKKIKLIVGCNEETGWACIDHYKEVAVLPETGFSPDADFPVIYAEKGILHVRLHFHLKKAPFSFLQGGSSSNMVCDLCEATPRTMNVSRANALGLEVSKKKIVARGKSAHGSTPEQGTNAILPILKYFEEKHEVVRNAIACLFDDVHGIKNLKDETGNLTISPNIVKYRKHDLQITCDIRYPATMSANDVHEVLKKFGVQYETLHHQEPIMCDKKSPLIQTMLAVYEECTGKKAEPIAIGGGTYARALKHGVAFGPEMAGDEAVVHQADEYITIERVELLLNIYRKAIKRLTA